MTNSKKPVTRFIFTIQDKEKELFETVSNKQEQPSLAFFIRKVVREYCKKYLYKNKV